MTHRDVACILVHYRRFPDSIAAIESILRAGIAPENLHVVDTGEDSSTVALAAHCAREGVVFHAMPNRGYGAAVNHGMARIRPEETRFTLVVTHEVILEANALVHLLQPFETDPTTAVVGPTLVDLAQADVIWSTGGSLSPVLNMPTHHGAGPSSRIVKPPRPVRRDWVDGACCVYRSHLLARYGIREDFFLYFEETDLHARFRRDGLSVYWSPDAVAGQSSDGIPPYYLARNLQLFQRLHGRWWHRQFSVPLIAARRLVGRVLRGRSGAGIRDLLRGWLDGRVHRFDA